MTLIPQEEDAEEHQQPHRQTLCQSLRRDSHIKCLILTLLICGCFAVITWCSVAQVTRLVINFQSFPITTHRRVSPCDDGYIYIPIVFVIMLYLVYLVECWHCNTRLELVYRMDVNAIYNHIEQMKNAHPIIWWKAVCYHYVRRLRQVTRYGNGDAYTSTQLYYERINTHVGGSCFAYGNCGVKDISKILVDLEKHPSTKIRFSKGFAFANIDSANEFEEQRTNFFRDNERHDDYLEMREGLDLVGCNFHEFMISYANSNCLPWYSSHFTFWMFSLLLLSWPFRVLIQYKTSYVHYKITKLFGINYMSPHSEINHLSRENTAESVELISNYTIAPSYSEAILAERIPLTNDNNGIVTKEIANRERQKEESIGNSAFHRLPNSISRSSLRNGQIVYFVAPLVSDGNHSIVRRLFSHNENPPSYEEALLRCHPIRSSIFNLFPLRRSITDRDFFRRLSSHWKRPWDSHYDIHRSADETEL